MIKHIVLWRLRETADDRTVVFARIKQALEAQRGRVPGLLKMEAGLNVSGARRAVDFALYSEFSDRAALDAYHRHPAHMETRAIVDPLAAEHWIVDYEV